MTPGIEFNFWFVCIVLVNERRKHTETSILPFAVTYSEMPIGEWKYVQTVEGEMNGMARK
jgi:hypothetical protein